MVSARVTVNKSNEFHAKVGIWKSAPFYEAIEDGISRLNLFLKTKEYGVVYDLIKLDPESEKTKTAHILLLDGGEDVNPARYGRRNSYSQFNDIRDEAEVLLLDIYRGIRWSGICRGHQLINVFLGGSLYQDIYREMGVTHSGPHNLSLKSPEDNKILYSFAGNSPVLVSSMHHQAIEYCAKSLYETCYADEISNGNGEVIRVVEGLQNSSGSIRTLQSHPEFRTCEKDGQLFSYLLHVDWAILAWEKMMEDKKRTAKLDLDLEKLGKVYYGSSSTTTNTYQR